MENLELSKHVHVVQRDGDYAVYNKLFGNLCLLDAEANEFLQTFAAPKPADGPSFSTVEKGLIAEFKDRFFLVPEGFDEREYVDKDKQFRSENLETGYLLKGIQLVLTNDCNLGCTYCFQEVIPHATPPAAITATKGNLKDSALTLKDFLPNGGTSSGGCGSSKKPEVRHSSRNEKKMTAEMAIETVKSAMKSVKDAGNSILTVEFFGGEPLLNWPAIEAVLDALGNGEAYGVSLHYSMTTNATSVTDEIARKLRKYNVLVTVSFDSPKNVNRLTKTGKSADSIIARGLDVLRRNDSILTFNTVVSVGNVDDVDADGLIDVAKSHNVRAIGLILDLDIKPYEDAAGMAKVVNTVLDICDKARAAGIPITGYWHQIFEQIAGAQAINLQKGYKTCAAEGCKLSFEPSGEVTHCKTTEKTIGHISALTDVFKSSWYRDSAMRAYETTPFCRGCMVEGFCSGLCMGTLQKSLNRTDEVIPAACKVYRELTTRLIQAIPSNEGERFTLT